jgi:hypothetical protein
METLQISEDGTYAIPIMKPQAGFKATMLELVFDPGTRFPLTLTSGTLITPDQYPFPPFEPEPIAK